MQPNNDCVPVGWEMRVGDGKLVGTGTGSSKVVRMTMGNLVEPF